MWMYEKACKTVIVDTIIDLSAKPGRYAVCISILTNLSRNSESFLERKLCISLVTSCPLVSASCCTGARLDGL